MFRCPLVCDSERNALLLPQKLLAMPLPYPQPEYSALFRDMCRQSMASLQDERDLVEAIREVIVARGGQRAHAGAGRCAFQSECAYAAASPAEIGTSYRALLEGERQASACRYLSSTGLTVAAIAGQLGYADARSFRTAFRRWMGTTPAAYRLQARAAGAAAGNSVRISRAPRDQI